MQGLRTLRDGSSERSSNEYMRHLHQLPGNIPRFECTERIQCEAHVYPNPAIQFLDSELFCNLVLNELYIELSFPLAFILLGVLQLCLWHSVKDKQLTNKETRGLMSMNTEMIMVKSSFWQLPVQSIKLQLAF